MRKSVVVRLFAVLGALALAKGVVQAEDLAAAPVARTDPRFEIAILAGYRFEGTLSFLDNAFGKIEVADTPTYAVSFGYNLNPNYETELFYSYASPQATSIALEPGDPNRTFNLGLHEIQVGILGYLTEPGKPVRLYLELLLGVTIFGTDQNLGDSVKFTPGISLGAKASLSDHVGVRAEAHYSPMFLFTTGDGYFFCFESDGCWDTGARYLQQVDLRAGVTFRF
jgi:hypothetical protein